MVSQGSDCDSDGIPGYMQDDTAHFEGLQEEGFSQPSMLGDRPIPIAGSLFREVFLQNPAGGEASSHIEVDCLVEEEAFKGFGVEKVRKSALDIPVVVSDEDNDVDEGVDTALGEEDIIAAEKVFANPIAKAAFAINRGERNELIALRKKMMEMQNYMVKKGLSMAQFEKDKIEKKTKFNFEAGLKSTSRFISGRDEFGLPIFTNKGMSQDVEAGGAKQNNKPVAGVGVSSVKDKDGNETNSQELPSQTPGTSSHTGHRTWANIV